ncbi:mechanosensitive ion channel family protein [Herbiconiux sp. L3-i23]|uniref:mechanosensitive ion channel family protein n=1 Tax=Herbiconiux sp. L3-i23 TaxID=2905871 RepID=UPI0020527C87|nr:mechanosensitive ion channel family protein [Herbiconiux sp. L3-i23]BDI21723.1 mechanosensitive ion channel protein MscS [Herbiconiux sp. L3-i23]
MTGFLDDVLANDYARAGIYAVIAFLIALIATSILGRVFRWVAAKRHWADGSVRALRRPFRTLAAVVAVWIALEVAVLPGTVRDGDRLGPISHLFLIATIGVAAWFICRVLIFAVDLSLNRYRTDVRDNRVARRIRTQVLILRRLAIVAVVIVALGSILLTFPGAQAAGASLLASAGLVSVIAGLAAQSALANVFAGMQLAFSGAIRVDDVVIVEQQWGRIEEITLTYVVVHIWDDRRMVLPSTYFTTTPFENWTRKNSELLGSVEFDLDWRVSPREMRDEMHRVLERTELWDKRTAVLQVTDALGGYVRVRILVTAIDAPTLFDLRCYIREELVAWLHERSPQSIPRTRVQMVEEEVPKRRAPKAVTAHGDDRSLFAGDAAAEKRASQFTGPISTLTSEEIEQARTGPDRGRGDGAAGGDQ